MTIDDIAKKAKVSKATVSRVLNDSGYVGEETKTKINEIIEKYNYVPSSHARNLSKQDSDVIGVVVPESENPFFGEVFVGISEIANENGLAVMYCNTRKSEELERRALNMFRQQRIKGLIITPATEGKYSNEQAQSFESLVESLNVPVILLDRDVNPTWSGVFTDGYQGSYTCTKLLIDEGHTKIGNVTGDLDLKIAQTRLKGYKGALQEAGLKIEEKYIYEGDFAQYKSYEIVKEMLKSKDRPTAIVTANNLTTVGAIRAINEAGLKIPDDIAMVGFDDVQMINFMNIKLTVAERKTKDMGHEAMALLLKLIEEHSQGKKPKMTNRIVMIPEIIKRGSEKLIKK